MQTPFHSDEIAAYHRASAKAEAKYGRSIDLSLSPGGWVATSYVDFLCENAQMWRISDDLWDRWEGIYQRFARLARWVPFQTAGHWADADLPTSTDDTITLLANPALREVLAGSTNNRETVRERIFTHWWEDDSYCGEFIVWAADAADWADGTPSVHRGGHYAALFWTGNDDFEIGGNIQLQSIVGLDAREDGWKLTDLFAGMPGPAANVRIEGDGTDRIITGTIPVHGVLWIVIDPIAA